MREEPSPPPTPWRYPMYLLGAVMVFIGLKGIIHNDNNENPIYWAKLFVGGAIAHDLIFAPIVAIVAVVLLRLIPRAYRAPVQIGLLASVVLVLAAYPGIRGFNSNADNLSVEPLNYSRGIGIALGVVWVVVVVAEVGRFLRRRRARP